jgi:Flp pilus assembly protein TadB
MKSNIMSNLGEEREILELIRDDSETKKEKITEASLEQIKILNAPIPLILRESENSKELVSVEGLRRKKVFILRKTKKNYLKNLNILRNVLKSKEKNGKVNGGNYYIKFSTKIFHKLSSKLLIYNRGLSEDLKAANIAIIPQTYISMMLLSVLLSIIFGIALFFSVGLNLIIGTVILPITLFILFYLYPSSRANEIDKKINSEIAFATIHMGALAGANIGPIKLFEIISSSGDYPSVGFEIRKVLNQVTVFGYNISSSLKNVAKKTRNNKLSELLGGIATNLNNGGELRSYLEKKSESFLVDYKLERKKYIDLASTFLDIYISVLIAAPLIFILLAIIMDMVGLGSNSIGFGNIILFSVMGIVILNVLFILVLNFKQPETQ